MSELYRNYIDAIQNLLLSVNANDDDYLTLLTLQGRLARLSQSELLYGETQSSQANFAQILEMLNRTSLKWMNKSFNELAGLGTMSERTSLNTVIPKHQFMSGVVINVNVSNFSTQIEDHSAINEFLLKEVHRFLDIVGTNYWLDFQSGYFLLFIERISDETKLQTLVKGICFGLQLQIKALEPSYRLGITIHWESDAEYHNLGDKVYLLGNGLNHAQLLMSFSNGGHFFISTQVYDSIYNLFNAYDNNFAELLKKLRAQNRPFFQKVFEPDEIVDSFEGNVYYCEKFSLHDKHKRHHEIYNFFVGGQKNENLIGNRTVPSHRVAIEYRDPRIIDPQQEFIRRLIDSDEVTIIGITHEGTARFLEEALRERKNRFWRKVQVVFPSRNILSNIIEQHKTVDDRHRHWEGGKQSVFRFLLSQGKDYVNNWECLEYDGNLPFIGNWFISNETESVRIAPLLPGRDAREVYYTEFFSGTKAYEQVRDAINVICNRSTKIIEWNLYGKINSNKELVYRGIVNRKRLNELPRKHLYYFPVVLVMLHGEVAGCHQSILQKRTIFNASNDFNVYSNISGRLTDIDVYMSEEAFPDITNYDDKDDDIAAKIFRSQTSLRKDPVLPEKAWLMAAVREVQEELGLNVNPERFTFQCAYPLERNSGNLIFNIFSLELIRTFAIDEFQTIKQSRPHANLVSFSLGELKQLHVENKLNALLQSKYEEVFVPIFNRLEIEKEC